MTNKQHIKNDDTTFCKPHATLKIKIMSTIMWLIMGGLIPFYCLVVYGLFFLDNNTKHKFLITWPKLFTFLCKYLCGVNYTVIGMENIPKVPVIFASNHQSTWETMAFSVFLPKHIYILKRELIRIPLFGWALSSTSPIAINREDKRSAVMQILEQAIIRIKDGFSIMVFPEGTRLPPGAKENYKTGVARVAINLNLPVVPIAHNSGHIMPRSSFYLYPGTVTIIISKPIYPDHDTAEEFTEKIRSTIYNELREMGEL